ncbi:MAG: tetratricopeptide repeat protein [Deltaproteobacteria bacterium]|nr:tetratricopeptide repeat protein [Deltaproteobacteria bacterium]
MRFRAFAFVLATSFATTSVTLPVHDAFAQGMDADTKEAKTLFEDGVKLYKAGKYEEARVKFKAAYGLKKRPSIILNLAHAELQTKRPLDAIAHFKEVLALPDAKPDDKDEAKTGLADARKQVGTLVVDAPTGTVVTIDGESRTVPGDSAIEVLPGVHTVVLKHAGKDHVQKVDLAAGQTVEVKPGAVTPPPVPTATATATATATTPPPAPTETAPPAPTETAAPAETAPPPPPPPPTKGDKRGFFEGVHPVTYVAAGVTVLGAIGWIAFYASSQTHYANADRYAEAILRPTCGTPDAAGKPCTSAANKALYRDEGNREIQDGDSQKSLAIVSGVVTGVAAGATVLTYILLRKKETKPAVAFIGAPTLGGGVTFSLVGQF